MTGRVDATVGALAAGDRVMKWLGAEVVEGDVGRAVVRMRVREEHLNFNGSCHGGTIFALGDVAFGLASNSHGVVAIGIDVHAVFSAPARPGEELYATATELTRSKRLATYRIEVAREDGRLVAILTGTVFVSGKTHNGQDA